MNEKDSAARGLSDIQNNPWLMVKIHYEVYPTIV